MKRWECCDIVRDILFFLSNEKDYGPLCIAKRAVIYVFHIGIYALEGQVVGTITFGRSRSWWKWCCRLSSWSVPRNGSLCKRCRLSWRNCAILSRIYLAYVIGTDAVEPTAIIFMGINIE